MPTASNQHQQRTGWASLRGASLQASPDGLSLMLTVPALAEADPIPSPDQLMQWLDEQGVAGRVDTQALQQAVDRLARGEAIEQWGVAEGQAMVPAQDGRIERFARFRPHDNPTPIAELPKGRGGDQPLFCTASDPVLRYHSPASGEAGRDVWGQPIEPAEPADVTLPACGDHVRWEGNDLLAEVAGVVLFDKDQVAVSQTLVLSEDVTGQDETIEFDGEVHCQGDIRSGGRIRASGPITVEGTVEAAEVVSTAGDVILRGGVAGRGRALLRAHHDIVAHYAENADLLAGRDIQLQVGALHSRLIAGRAVTAGQNKGHLTGGLVMAGQGILVKQLGGRGGPATRATVGIASKTIERLGCLAEMVTRLERRKGKALKLADEMEQTLGDPHAFPEPQRTTYHQLRDLERNCDRQRRQIERQRAALLAGPGESADGAVKVTAEVMAHVTIAIGPRSTVPECGRGPWVFTYDPDGDRIHAERESG